MVEIADKPAFIDKMITLLREDDLPPNFVDRGAGLLETKPSTSGQWFEIWRHDVHGGYQMLESSLHTIRRRVAVSLSPVSPDTPADGPGDYWLSVEARKERLEAPERQITTASGALGIYSETTPTIEGVRGPDPRGQQWISLGRDVQLETYLLGRFAKFASASAPRDRASRPATETPAPRRAPAARQPRPNPKPAPAKPQPKSRPAVVIEPVD